MYGFMAHVFDSAQGGNTNRDSRLKSATKKLVKEVTTILPDLLPSGFSLNEWSQLDFVYLVFSSHFIQLYDVRH
jgi:hypothetical protein